MNALNLHDARILIVDDQEANILFLEGLLQAGGYQHWCSVQDPHAAVQKCAEFRPDLILLDLLMPGLDGFGVLEQLQPLLAKEVYLPVLVLTVDLTADAKRRTLAAGANDFLAKPLDAIEVLLRVKNLLETRFIYRQLQERADERIREQAALIDEASDAILVCDLRDRITFWSRGAEMLYGWTAAEVMGRDVLELLSSRRVESFAQLPPDGDGALEEARRTMTATGKWSGELWQRMRSGREVVVASRWTLVRDAEGLPRSKLVLDTDITEKKKTEDKLLRAQRLENIGRLAGGIAHDLNNILSPLTMGIDLLEASCTDAAHEELLRMMQASLRRGTEMVRQILTFARGLDSQRQALQLQTLIAELTTLFRQTFPRSIVIETSVAEDLWPVHGDATQLHQVLANLCINARDAMPDGGQLRIAANNRVLDASTAHTPARFAPGQYVELEVADTGTGIPSNLLDKIFEPFFTTKAVGKGTGLGLSTSHDIIRNHGGHMRVDSVAGQGSRFVAYLPALASDQPVSAERTKSQHHELASGRAELILVVDDEAALLQIAKLTLTTAGYRVLTARSGAEAVSLYSRQPHDIRLVVTDLMMSAMDGRATIQALERLDPHVAVVVISGLVGGPEMAQALGPAVKAYLPKPYTVEALLSTVRCVLDNSEPRTK